MWRSNNELARGQEEKGVKALFASPPFPFFFFFSLPDSCSYSLPSSLLPPSIILYISSLPISRTTHVGKNFFYLIFFCLLICSWFFVWQFTMNKGEMRWTGARLRKGSCRGWWDGHGRRRREKGLGAGLCTTTMVELRRRLVGHEAGLWLLWFREVVRLRRLENWFFLRS